MPISKVRRPVVLITGSVIGIEKKQKYNDAGKPTGDVDRHDVTIVQSSHATPDVRFPYGPDSVPVPSVGDVVALIAELGETREYGANMRVLRYATEDDLNAVAALVLTPAGK